jgi:hypothetical protein
MTTKEALQIVRAYQYGDSVEINGKTEWMGRHGFDLNDATVDVIECALTEQIERDEQDAILTSAMQNLKMQYDYALCHDGVIHNPVAWALYQTWKEFDK